ncbi:MAG: 16S rRNA (guanine(527)-N(7))-methyltransferase RsmG [Nitrospirales bacterium]|nr:16S rRNA (guanine(527)-N(7))-methyltransferase RsmG [Nitrospirales bacterium]
MINLLRDGASQIGCPLSNTDIERFDVYYTHLVDWNKKTNLTGSQDAQALIVTLFLDSLAFSESLSKYNCSMSILDVGTGAGFPGLPLKIVNPMLDVTLVEPNLKKVAFLHHIIGTLDLTQVTVFSQQIQTFGSEQLRHKKIDFVLSKALKCSSYLPYVHHLIHETSQIVLWRSSHLDPQQDLHGFAIDREISYTLPFGFGERNLSILTSKS